MYKFKRILQTVNYLKQTLRNATDITLSARERAWHQAQKTYDGHPHLLYSSSLEELVPHFSWKEMRKKRMRKRYGPKIPGQNSFNPIENKGELENCEAMLKSYFPKDWMEDYEFYKGAIDAHGNLNSTHGTADPSIPPSNVPCNGCGAHLHCANPGWPGYIPKEIFDGRTNNELKTIVCQRCHFLQVYNIALDVEIPPECYVETISKIKDEYALAIIIVDLLDLPCSIWPGIQEVIGKKRPVFLIGNKVDLLPRDSASYLEQVKECLRTEATNAGFDALNIKYVSLISAKTGYGIEELITQLHNLWRYKGNVYLLGCTNVGKSSLFNILLNSDYCRPEASDLVKKATTCIWPGTTLQLLKFPIFRPSAYRLKLRYERLFSERSLKAAEEKLRRDQAQKTGSVQAAKLIGTVGRTFKMADDLVDAFAMSSGTNIITTFEEKKPDYAEARWCYDTPGVMHPAQITNLLTTEELLKLEPSQMISPRAVRLKPGMSIFLSGLARLDFISCDQELNWIKVIVFSSAFLPITICPTDQADNVYKDYLGTNILGIPRGTKERLSAWPGLMRYPENFKVLSYDNNCICAEVVLSSAGWVGLSFPTNVEGIFSVWTPFARGIYLRTPALIPYANRLIGKHIRNSLAYNRKKPFNFLK